MVLTQGNGSLGREPRDARRGAPSRRRGSTQGSGSERRRTGRRRCAAHSSDHRLPVVEPVAEPEPRVPHRGTEMTRGARRVERWSTPRSGTKPRRALRQDDEGVGERGTDLRPERRPGEVDLGDVAGEDLLPVHVLTPQDRAPQGEVVFRVRQHLRHVVAAPAQQPFERQLEPGGARPSQSRPHHAQGHCRIVWVHPSIPPRAGTPG